MTFSYLAVDARFIAPFVADEARKDHWVAGSQYVWTQPRGFAIASGTDWI